MKNENIFGVIPAFISSLVTRHMTKRFLQLLGAFVIVACAAVPEAYSQSSYSSKAIAGTVVDADTGEPLAGVNIAAQWMIDRSFVGDEHALLKVIETVSDKGGNYGFPAWGPILLRPMSLFGNGRNPEIAYFKSGYWPEYERNEIHDDDDIANREPPLGEFVGNGKTVKLRKWDGDDASRFWWQINFLATSMPTLNPGGDWKKYPRMTLAIRNEDLRLHKIAKLPFHHGVEGFDFERLSDKDKEYLKRVAE